MQDLWFESHAERLPSTKEARPNNLLKPWNKGDESQLVYILLKILANYSTSVDYKLHRQPSAG